MRLTPIMNSPTGIVRAPSGPSSSTSASSAASTGRPSPAGEHVPRLPPIVAALRICGEPTVRAAWASAGTSVGQRRPLQLGVGDAGAEAQRAAARVVGPRAQLGHPADGDDRLVAGQRGGGPR